MSTYSTNVIVLQHIQPKNCQMMDALFTWCIEVTQINGFILFCLTREEDTKQISLKKFKQLLIKQLLAKANTIIPENFKHHVAKKPRGKLKRVPSPSHMVTWVSNDKIAIFEVCQNTEKEPHLYAKDVVFISIQKSVSKNFMKT